MVQCLQFTKDSTVQLKRMPWRVSSPSMKRVKCSFFQGFPTIYWLPKNSKKPVSYGAGRELDDFVKYIAKEASEELKGFDRSGKAKKVEL